MAIPDPLPSWRALLRGAREREGRAPQARWLQLASVAADGTPRVRTLVSRARFLMGCRCQSTSSCYASPWCRWSCWNSRASPIAVAAGGWRRGAGRAAQPVSHCWALRIRPEQPASIAPRTWAWAGGGDCHGLDFGGQFLLLRKNLRRHVQEAAARSRLQASGEVLSLEPSTPAEHSSRTAGCHPCGPRLRGT
jgi:hypothetical protein